MYDYVISHLQVEFTTIYAFFALLGRDTYMYRSLYDVYFFNYSCFATKTVVCVACEDAGNSLVFTHRGEFLD